MFQTSKDPATFRGHIPALDAIRGLAIVVVTMFRFREGPVGDVPSKISRQLLDQGHFGVDLFFVLSGFLITGILFDSKEERSYFRNFYLRRSLRIFPLYYISLVVTLLLLPAVLPRGVSAFSETSPHAPWLWFYGANLAQCWYQDWVLGPFNHFWSLAIEEHFYLVWPLLIYFFDRRQAIGISLACIGIGLVSRTIALCFWPDTMLPPEVFTLCRLDALGAGAFLALTLRVPGGYEWLAKWQATIIGTAGLLVVVATVTKHVFRPSPLAAQIVYFSAFTPVAILFAAFIFKAIHHQPSKWIALVANQRWLQSAGKFSYGWYVFQGLIYYDLTRYLTNEMLLEWCGGIPTAAIALRILIGGGLSLFMAVVSWHLVEKHFLAWKPKHDRKVLAQPTVAPILAGELVANGTNRG